MRKSPQLRQKKEKKKVLPLIGSGIFLSNRRLINSRPNDLECLYFMMNDISMKGGPYGTPISWWTPGNFQLFLLWRRLLQPWCLLFYLWIPTSSSGIAKSPCDCPSGCWKIIHGLSQDYLILHHQQCLGVLASPIPLKAHFGLYLSDVE